MASSTNEFILFIMDPGMFFVTKIDQPIEASTSALFIIPANVSSRTNVRGLSSTGFLACARNDTCEPSLQLAGLMNEAKKTNNISANTSLNAY